MNNGYFLKLYSDFLKRSFRPQRKLKVVFDCSNGTTGLVLKRMLNKELGMRNKKSPLHNSQFIILNAGPDGNFPAHGPNPLARGAMDQLAREVVRRKADLGVIFDADGDRVFFVDNRGRRIGADEAGFILTQEFKAPYVVGEVSSWRLKKLNAKSKKLKVFVSRVGHYFFKQLMRAGKASLGLEHSGHFYFKDFFYCDSGIFAAIQAMNFVSRLEGGVAAWLDALPKYYRSGEINYRVKDKKKVIKAIERRYKKQATHISKLDGLTMEFGNEWWFNVRLSNTENLLRLNVEAASQKTLKRKLTEINKML